MTKLFPLMALSLAFSAVPALAAEDLSKMSTERLCSKFGNPASKLFMRPDVREEIDRRGATYCTDPNYIAAKRAEAQRQADALIELGDRLKAMDNNRRQSFTPSYPSAPGTAVGFYVREQISGTNKICYYNRMGSAVALTIASFQLCPPTY